MVRIIGEISAEDRKFLNYAVVYTLDHLVSRRQRKDASVTINVGQIGTGRKLDGDMDCKIENGIKKFTVNLSTYGQINNKAATTLYRYKKLLITLFHELVHVKQYMKGEAIDFKNSVRFKGKTYGNEYLNDDLAYFGSPWEMEARAFEIYLWVRFRNHIRQLRKSKA